MGEDPGWRPKRTFGKLARKRLAEAQSRQKKQVEAPPDGKAYRGACANCDHLFIVCSPVDQNQAATDRLPPMVGDMLECDVCHWKLRVDQVVGFQIKTSKFDTDDGWTS